MAGDNPEEKEEMPEYDYSKDAEGQNQQSEESEQNQQSEESEQNQQSEEDNSQEEEQHEPLTIIEKAMFEKMRYELDLCAEVPLKPPVLLPEQKQILKKASKSPEKEEKKQAGDYKWKRISTRIKFWFHTIMGKMVPSGSSTASIFIPVGLILLCAMVMLSIFLSGSAFGGIKGDKFYGLRTIYEDEEQATIELLEEYYEVIEQSVISAKAITTITTTDTFNLTLTVQPELLQDSYSFENFDENTFKTENTEVYNLIKQIADKVYEADKEEGAVVPTNVVDTLKTIKYFGFDEILNTDIKTLLADYIKAHYSFVEKDGKSVSKTDIDNEIDARINSIFEQDKYKTRTEKLFVKDYIYTSTTSYTENLETLNYKAHIFMSKEQVAFTKFHFVVSKADFTSFNMSLMYNNEEISLDKSINKDYGDDVEAYNYKTELLFSKQIEAYNYVELPEERVSFYDLIGTALVDSMLKINEENAVLQMNYEKENQLILKFDQDINQPFLSIELETDYQDKVKESPIV